jgi:ligand-binding SRPBCC domain-containing protein
MVVVKDGIHIDAPIDRCFLLSTSIDLVKATLHMRPVSGRTKGLIEAGDRVEWRGWKFGLPQRHESLITTYDRPRFFQDAMVRGRFAKFQHDHDFFEVGGQTLLKDTVRFTMPFGPAGELVGKHILTPHICELMKRRFQLLKRVAESDKWKSYLPDHLEPHAAEPHLIPRGPGDESSRSS